MEEQKKAPRRIYLVQRIGVPTELIDEFGQFWIKNTLPLWEKHGSKFIVAGRNLVGAPSNELTRIFEFENIHHWERMQEATWDWWEKEEGEGRATPPKGYVRYLALHEQRLLRAVYWESCEGCIKSSVEGQREEGEKAPRRVYLVHKISVPYELVNEYNQFWKKNMLPFWEQQGAKLIMAGVHIAGGPANEVTRVYEFENIHHWEKMQEATWNRWEREEGPGRTTPPKEYLRYLRTSEQRLLRAVY
jgi:hypothetical protein